MNNKHIWTSMYYAEPYLPENPNDYNLSTYRQLSYKGDPQPGSVSGFVVQGWNNNWYAFSIDYRYVVIQIGLCAGYKSKLLAMKAVRAVLDPKME